MRAKIPADYRQPLQMAFGLDVISGIPLGACIVLSMAVLTGHAPVVSKVLEVGASVILGGLLGFGRWPFDGYGDKLHVWGHRALDYYQRSHQASLFEVKR